ncbi:MAG: DUF2330 domain-containing protein, partial [Waterburya sp.]
RILFSCILTGVIFIFVIKPALAFCGFYDAKADTSLYNQASQVIIARDEERTVLTMSNDYQGEVKDFAMVVPVTVVLQKEQVHVSEGKIIQRLDDFSAPRLVEYFDEDPCIPRFEPATVFSRSAALSPSPKQEATDLGVTIEEQFSVGEYDIVILSAKESDGLETWLIQNNYKIPKGAKELLQPYIRQNLKFFVAKVNLAEYNSNGFEKLRPISIAFESPKFMLPIRLGMMNAQGDQDLIVYLLSPQGQVQLTNYRTVKVPSDSEIPEFVKEEFKEFYTAMFQNAYEQQNKQVAFLEYAWDMSSCDPCSAEPLNQEELKQAGVFWLDQQANNPWGGSNVFITRLHVRYSRDKFPEDLKFQATSDRNLFQGRYIIRHPFTGNITCDAGKEYQQSVKGRQEREAKTLASLTGWEIKDIRDRIKFVKAQPMPWWENLWER